jgi:hypothetical protein
MKKIFGWALGQPNSEGNHEQLQDDAAAAAGSMDYLLERKEEPTPPSSPLLYNSQEVRLCLCPTLKLSLLSSSFKKSKDFSLHISSHTPRPACKGVRKMRVTLFVNGARTGGKVMLVRHHHR